MSRWAGLGISDSNGKLDVTCLCDIVAFYVWIQLLQAIVCVFCPMAAQMLFLEEEIDP